jgi:hypothetical protein
VAVAVFVVLVATTASIAIFRSRDVAPLGSPLGAAVSIAVGQPVEGVIDARNATRTYQFTIVQLETVAIDVTGDFDSYLELYRGGESSPFREDDDSGGNYNPRVVESLGPGTYFALVRPYSAGTSGSFTLTVSTSPWSGQPNDQPQVIPTQLRSGVASLVTGPAPVAAQTPCDVLVTPAESGRLNCRIRVTCGGAIIYGRDAGGTSYGFAECVLSSDYGRPPVIRAQDAMTTPADGDPRVDLDTSLGQVTVIDDGASGPWAVTVSFTSPAQ